MTNSTKARKIAEALYFREYPPAPYEAIRIIQAELDWCDQQETKESQAVGAAQDSKN